MKRSRTLIIKIVLALAVSAVALTQVQQIRAEDQLRFGNSIELGAGERADDVLVFLGSAKIDGTVEGDLLVSFGSLILGRTSAIEQDVVVLGGSAEVMPGAVVEGDFVVLGGALDAPESFSPGGELVILGGGFGGGEGLQVFPAVLAWLGKGLLWGRPLVPELLWTWIFIAVFALLYLATNAIFERPVRDVASALASKPIICFLVGVLVVLLMGPVSLLLAISVVGLPAVPLLWFAVFFTVILGKVGITRWIGGRVRPEQFPGDPAEAARSVAIGFAVISVAYMVPVLGFAAWTVLGVLGLGAATTHMTSSLRREQPRSTETALVPVAMSSQSGAADASRVESPQGEGSDQADDQSGRGAEKPLEQATHANLPLATFPVRVCAVALDLVPFVIIAQSLGTGVVLTMLMFVAYNSAMWAWRGTTVGGMICHLRVIRTDGRELAPSDGVVRGMASVVSMAFLGLGWIWAAWDGRRQSWHDRAAGTYVVRAITE